MDELNLDEPNICDEVELVVKSHIQRSDYISLASANTHGVQKAYDLFTTYASQLRTVCISHTLSHERTAMLTEQEVVVGTIVAKASQPRKRKDLMSKVHLPCLNFPTHVDEH